MLDNLTWPRPCNSPRRPWLRLLAALVTVALSVYWGIVRPGVWFPSPPDVVVALALLVPLTLVLSSRQAFAVASASIVVILGTAAAQEHSLPKPEHYPYTLAATIRALPGDGPIVLVSRRGAGDMGEMERAHWHSTCETISS